MELNETERNICRAIIRAANHACGVVGYEGVYSTSPEISFYIDTGGMLCYNQIVRLSKQIVKM